MAGQKLVCQDCKTDRLMVTFPEAGDVVIICGMCKIKVASACFHDIPMEGYIVPNHECRCGYRCGGPGRCKLPILECLQQDDGNHFVQDCDHDFTSGPGVEFANGWTSSCKCGVTSIAHDSRVGP